VRENNSLKSISPDQIVESIRKMYEVARQNPDKQFKVAYTHGLDETSLNGYTGAEMIKMFKDAGPIPSNVLFSKNWTDHWREVISEADQQTNSDRKDDNLENDPQRFNDPKEDKDVISSKNTILSNEELAIWNKAGLGPMPRILVASERTDPAFHV
jgi:hypothetical protein